MVDSSKTPNNVAIVHDWLIGGGAEKVIEELHKIYPEAPIYTAYCTDEWRKRLDNKVVAGYLQNWPFSKLRKYLPILMSNWFQSLNLEKFDTIIVSSGNGTANHIKKPFGSKLVFYCHTPTHYLWDKNEEYLSNPGFGVFNPLVRFGLNLFVNTLRQRDLSGATQSDAIISNSSHTKEQIQKYYKKDSVVVFPPVDTELFKPKKNVKRSGFVTVGRQVPYKRFDIVVSACSKLELPLTVYGNGPEHNKLRGLAGKSVRFIENASDKQIEEALQSSEAFIFPSKEDFGIAPVEALAAGCPVIAYKSGGALDYVIPKKNGLFFADQTVGSLINCMNKFKDTKFKTSEITSSAHKFSKQSFTKGFTKLLNN